MKTFFFTFTVLRIIILSDKLINVEIIENELKHFVFIGIGIA